MFTAYQIAEICGGKILGNAEARIKKVNTDSRTIESGDLFVALKGETFNGNQFAEGAFLKGATVCVVSESINPPEGCASVVVEDGGKALLDLASAYRAQMGTKIIAVTGSVGKTTTKEMCACALSGTFSVHKTSGNFNNDIGMPLTLLKLQKEHDAAVIEMGMNHFGEIERLSLCCKPDAALITNIGLSHIENLKTQENILKAKLEILRGLKEGGALILNADDPLLSKVSDERFNIITYGIKNDCDVKGEVISQNEVMVLGNKITLSVEGEHNLLNACAAMAVAKAFGADLSEAAKGISSYKTDERRQSITKSKKGFYVISDYYNASPQSVEVALKTLSAKDGRKIAVLGDMLELGDYSAESHKKSGIVAAELGIDMLFAYGKDSRLTYEAAKDKIEAYHFDDKEELCEVLESKLSEGDWVLIKGSRGMKMETVYEKIMR